MNRKERRKLEKQARRRARTQHVGAPAVDVDIVAALEEGLENFRAGRWKVASDLCEMILQIDPVHPDALNLAGAVRMEKGDAAGAVPFLERAVAAVPDFAQAHFNLGTALSAAGRLEEAVASQRRALEIEPDYLAARYNLANALRQLAHPEAAIEDYVSVIEADPAYPGAATNLASAYLEMGQPEAAMAACDKALAVIPGDRDALSFKAIAAAENGDMATAARILELDGLIQPFDVSCPDGYETIEDFNRALVDHVLAHPTLTREPHNKATRFGQQTENLAVEPKGPIAQLEGLIADAADGYLEARKSGDHPYPPLIPHLSKIDIWGTVLGAQGHQAAHMHRAAWLSGVYYAQLPDVMRNADGSQAGWIEFGRPPEEFPCRAEHPLRMIEPKEGRMVLFPSYIYHRTVPFESREKRISIAFDLLA